MRQCRQCPGLKRCMPGVKDRCGRKAARAPPMDAPGALRRSVATSSATFRSVVFSIRSIRRKVDSPPALRQACVGKDWGVQSRLGPAVAPGAAKHADRMLAPLLGGAPESTGAGRACQGPAPRRGHALSPQRSGRGHAARGPWRRGAVVHGRRRTSVETKGGTQGGTRQALDTVGAKPEACADDGHQRGGRARRPA